jgi:hypothetical protein
VSTRSEAQVCGRSPAEIVDSNPAEGMDVCRNCCVMSGRGLCDDPVTRPEKSYRMCCVVLCDLETSKKEEAMARFGPQPHKGKKFYITCDTIVTD